MLPKAAQQPRHVNGDFTHGHTDAHTGAVTHRKFLVGQPHQTRHVVGPPQIRFIVIKHLDYRLHVNTSIRIPGKLTQSLEGERTPRSHPFARFGQERIPNGAGNRGRCLLGFVARPDFDCESLCLQSPRGYQTDYAGSDYDCVRLIRRCARDRTKADEVSVRSQSRRNLFIILI